MTAEVGHDDALLEPSVEEQRRKQDEFIGERVHNVLWRRKIPQIEMAQRLGIHQTALSHKLRGKRPFFSRELGAIAAALRVNPAYLLGFTDDPRPITEDREGIESRLGESNPRPFHYTRDGSTLTVAEQVSSADVLPLRRRA